MPRNGSLVISRACRPRRVTNATPSGASVAAGFLSNFVGDYPWVHMDIAGTAWVDKPTAYAPKGATGIGVRLLVQALRDWVEER